MILDELQAGRQLLQHCGGRWLPCCQKIRRAIAQKNQSTIHCGTNNFLHRYGGSSKCGKMWQICSLKETGQINPALEAGTPSRRLRSLMTSHLLPILQMIFGSFWIFWIWQAWLFAQLWPLTLIMLLQSSGCLSTLGHTR